MRLDHAHVDLTDGALLLGDGGDVPLADLMVVTPAHAGSTSVLEASRAGTVVVVTGSAESAGAAALGLVGNGAERGRVVVEIPMLVQVPPLSTVDVRRLGEFGLLAGALFPPLARSTPEAVGWEVGTVTRLLVAGVRTFRGLDPTRFARIRAVHEATEAEVAS